MINISSVVTNQPIWKLFLVISFRSLFCAVGFSSYTAFTAWRFMLVLSPFIWT